MPVFFFCFPAPDSLPGAGIFCVKVSPTFSKVAVSKGRAFGGYRVYRQFSLVMMDLDHFKQLNDTRGHLQGDRCLRLVAEVLRQEVGARAAFRYGGDEFCLVLEDWSPELAMNVCRRIQYQLEQVDDFFPCGYRPALGWLPAGPTQIRCSWCGRPTALCTAPRCGAATFISSKTENRRSVPL